jgi:hypothetical protein
MKLDQCAQVAVNRSVAAENEDGVKPFRSGRQPDRPICLDQLERPQITGRRS